MPEYSGYISVNPVDWGKVAGEASKQITDVLIKRQQERIQLDDLNADTQRQIENYEATKSPEINNFIMASAQTSKSFIQNQNDMLKKGLITPEQYKRNLQQTQVGFKSFKAVMDGFAGNIEEATRLQEEGVTGKQAQWVNDVNNSILTLKDKMMTVGPNGSLYIKDANSGQLYDVQSMMNPQNNVVKRVELYKEVDDAVKGLGAGARYNTETKMFEISPSVKENWDEEKEKLADAILSSDSRIASVLADNLMGYSFTDSEDRSENEILMQRDANRVWQPVLTDEQKKKAREIVMDQIEARVDYKATYEGVTARDRYMAAQRQASGGGGKKEVDYNKRIQQITRVVQPGGLQTSEGTAIRSAIKIPNYEDYNVESIEKRGDKYIFNTPSTSFTFGYNEAFAILNNAFNATTGFDNVNMTDLAGYMSGQQSGGGVNLNASTRKTQ